MSRPTRVLRMNPATPGSTPRCSVLHWQSRCSGSHANAPSKSSGMTLVEVLAVVVILSLLAATLVISFSGSVAKAKQDVARTAISQLIQKLELYRMERSAWPENELGLRALSDGHATPGDPWYLEPDKLLDPWNEPYWFVTPGPDQHPYEILSYGADGQPGGTGEDADVTSADLRGLK